MADDEERKIWPLGPDDLTVVDKRPHILPDVCHLSPLAGAPPVSEVVVAKHHQPSLSPSLGHSSVVRSQPLRVS